MGKKHLTTKGKKHLTTKEIIAQCKIVARERRMAERTPWTAVGIMCAYTIMKVEGFKGQRIQKITNKIEAYEAAWDNGEVDLEAIKQKVCSKISGEALEHTTYTEADITAKKGSYQYWLDSKQIAPQNTMNAQASRYLTFFYNALIEEYGFGKERLARVYEYMSNLMTEYVYRQTAISVWKEALYDEAGIEMEMPVDPETQKQGSALTGY